VTRFVDLSQEIPGLQGTRIHVLPDSAEARVRAVLERHLFEIRILEGARARGESEFFEEAARALELPAWFGANWDAFGDCLGDWVEGRSRRLAVVWRQAHLSLGGGVQVVVNAVLAFEAAAVYPSAEEEAPQLEVFLLGEGNAFRIPPAGQDQ
jgi:hypothetical protein